MLKSLSRPPTKSTLDGAAADQLYFAGMCGSPVALPAVSVALWTGVVAVPPTAARTRIGLSRAPLELCGS